MSLSKEKREAAKQYLIDLIANEDQAYITKTAEVFNLSRTAVYKYLEAFRKAGIIDSTNCLKPIFIKVFDYKLPISEEEIYSTDILPLLSDLPVNVQTIWEYAANEIINNAIDHSGANTFSLKIIRTYANITMEIADSGIGIFENIKTHYNLHSVDEAIEELFKGKLTTNMQKHSGEGIFFTSRIMDQFIAVSENKIFTQNEIKKAPEHSKGTLIFMQLSNSSPKRLVDIFDQFADVDGGFTKTSLPIKRIFQTFPVSRSQAKRLTNRFEEFEEVILDFEGVTEMGQGFGDELFRVYRDSHSEIILTPINMNDAVAKMYYHVTHRNH